MLKILKVRKNQGYQAIPDVTKAVIRKPFRGLPQINNKNCGKCTECLNICPTGAISLKPLAIDMGKCIFCGDCERLCQNQVISFTNNYKISTTSRKNLIINQNITEEKFREKAIQVKKEIKGLFGGSLKIRQVSAAGCNGCEWELNACSNVNFDMGRFGIEIVASPRHSDAILITGPISENMAPALEDAYQCTPDPKIVILAGSCTISGGIFQPSEALNRKFLEKYSIDLFIPGCPVHPLTVVNGILEYIGR